MPVGNEGAGIVVQGGSTESQKLMGRTVAMVGGAMYAQYRAVKRAHAASRRQTAAEAHPVRNPLTALGMIDDAREGHTALVHTAAASNLGQMLNKICLADGVGLVNIVRSAAQANPARSARNTSSIPSAELQADLTPSHATGATLAFDAIGGGKLAGQILTAMEISLKTPGHKPLWFTHAQAGLHLRPPQRWPTVLTAAMAWRGASAAS